MPHSERHLIPKGLKYPLFFLGLIIMIGGGLAVQVLTLPFEVAEIAGAVGFIVLILSIVLN